MNQIKPTCPVPKLGLGTFRSRNDDVKNSVIWALQQGLRHIDTASIYKNEEEIGLAVREAISSGIITSRQDIFITSKLSPYEQGTPKATTACENILNRLDLHYVDLVLIHWPGVSKLQPDSPMNTTLRRETWEVLEQFHSKGLFKHIGVSNYEIRHLEDLLTYNQVPVAALQTECHPLWPQIEAREFCKQHGIQFVAYSSLGAGNLLSEPTVVQLASKLGQTASQVLLRWGLQKGLCVIPKSIQQHRIAEFSPESLKPLVAKGETLRYLDEESEVVLDGLGDTVEKRKKFCWDPSIVTV